MEFVKTPETQFRPLPLTIIDLIAILLPGLLWLILFVTTFDVLWPRSPVVPATPSRVLLAFVTQAAPNWLTSLSALVMAALIGYGLKPLAMGITEKLLASPMLEPGLKIMGGLHFRRYKEKMNNKHIRFCDLRFPFDCLHEGEPYFTKLKEYFRVTLGCDVSTLPSHSMFTVAKRFLRISCPPLWEESERMEAEVRMCGTTLLAALYSFFLSLIAIARYRTDFWELGFWCFASLGAASVLTSDFIHTRDREVTYNYINCLLAISQLSEKPNPQHAGEVGTSPHD